MHTATICLTFLLFFIHYAASKIYVIDLTNNSHEDDSIKLRELLELFENPKVKRFKDIKSDKRLILKKTVPAVDDDCLTLGTTKAEKIKCLEDLEKVRQKKSIGRESIVYPGLYHEFYAQRPKKDINSDYNYGGLLKSKPSFTDLTREFSQDYLDVGELSRIEPKCPECLQDSQDRDYEYKMRSKDTQLIGVPKPKRRSSKHVEQTSDSSEDSSDSSDNDMRNDRRDRKRRKPKRFQVLFDDDASPESDEETGKKKTDKSFSSESEEAPENTKRESSNSDSESVEVTEKPVKTREKYSYLQGNKVYDNFRRRLQHFLPKRFHWDDDDIHHLGYYWFDGPRGKYS